MINKKKNGAITMLFIEIKKTNKTFDGKILKI